MNDEPEAYTLGSLPFLGLTIHLDSHPLIPRVETEYWVERMMAEIRSPHTFLDLCSGSGVIGCTALKQLPTTEVYFGEIDQNHEQTMLKNIRENNLDESRAHVKIGDLFEPFEGLQFDVIAANPPYVPALRELPASVANYEPALALRAGEDGLTVIRRIAASLKKHLKPGGQAWVECDSEHAKAALKLFTEQGFTAEVRPDQYERPRLIVISS